MVANARRDAPFCGTPARWRFRCCVPRAVAARAHVQRAGPWRARRRPRQGHGVHTGRDRRRRPRGRHRVLSARRLCVRHAAASQPCHLAPRRRRDARGQRRRWRLRSIRGAGLRDLRGSRDERLLVRSPPGARPAAGRHRGGGPDRRQAVVARRAEADRAPRVSRRPDPGHRHRQCRQLQHQPARLRRRRHHGRDHRERLRGRHRSRLLPERAHHRLPGRVARRRHRDEVEPGPGPAAGHRARDGQRLPSRHPA